MSRKKQESTAVRKKRLLREQGKRTEAPAAVRPRLRPNGILIVDDDEGVRGVLNVGMRQQGFAVWQAADGQEAVELYSCHREAIDVVLLDVRLPGLNGPQTLAALQKLNPRICCCFMSGELGGYSERDLTQRGAAAVLAKPFHLAEAALMLWALASHAKWNPYLL